MIAFIAGFIVGGITLVALTLFYVLGEDMDESDEGYL